ncbi:hypothetical protein NL346_27060, partial [Klebsiella pneumoniae]|nr:hypothetical protein [Klebsiella pneumoniae]
NEAIACESAANYYLSKGRELFARTYLIQSLHGFSNWGATEKVKQLQENYPELRHEHLTDGQPQEIAALPLEQGLFFASTTTRTGSSPEMD